MPTYSIICGILLSLIGIIGAIAAQSDGKFSVTALIPLFFGVPLILLGLVAQMKENLRKHLMHAALVIALLGLIGVLFSPAIKGLIAGGEIKNMTSFLAQISMAIVCLSFIIAGVKSFIAARRSE